MTGRRFQPPWRAARLSWRNSIGSLTGWSLRGGFHALADRVAFPDRCGAAWRNADGIRTIADQLSMVRETLWKLDDRTDVLLFHELSTV
jgi:hypothetical protein